MSLLTTQLYSLIIAINIPPGHHSDQKPTARVQKGRSPLVKLLFSRFFDCGLPIFANWLCCQSLRVCPWCLMPETQNGFPLILYVPVGLRHQ